MKVYELEKAITDVINNSYSIDEETGELLFDETNLEQLQGELEQKIEWIACEVKNITAMSDALANEKKNIDARIKANEKKAKYLEKYVDHLMKDVLQKDKFSTPRVDIKYRKSSMLVIDNEEQFIKMNWDKDFIKIKTEKSIDKMLVKKLLKTSEIDGASIQESKNISIK